MSTSETAAPRSSLANAVDIVIAPQAAFERIRVVPAWGWAFLVASLLGIAGAVAALPATQHAFATSAPSLYAAQVSKLPPDQQAAMLGKMVAAGRIVTYVQWLFIPIGLLIGALISAVVMLIANAASRGDGTFKRFFALAVTVSVINAIGLVLNGVITLVRGPSSYETMQSVQTNLPSLAMLAPGAGSKLGLFLGTINVAAVWATALTALGMVAVGKVKPAVAWIAAVGTLLIAAGVGAAFVP